MRILPIITRRKAIKLFSRKAAVLTVLSTTSTLSGVSLVGCQSDDLETSSSESGDSWAEGTTSLITASYPEDALFPSAQDENSVCNVEPTQDDVLGPCFYPVPERQDIAEGVAGLPMQMSLKIIDEQCQPVANAEVDVWHCDHRGVYSGDTTQSANVSIFNGRFCTGGDTAAQSQSWGRGRLITNADGRVDFKSIFPGWYPGRPVHVHFTVTVMGVRSLVSQLYFDDALCDDIYISHSLYSQRGLPDTRLQKYSGAQLSAGLKTKVMETRSAPGGTLQAYKLVQLS